MQFAVPQFTEVEDKLIGPLTLKQFGVFVAMGGIILLFWSILGLSLLFFLFSVPVALLGLGLAFGRFNGRPLFVYIGSFISFFSKPQTRIFHREEPTMIIGLEPKKAEVQKSTNPELNEPAESRLKKLAYLLDQKTSEEKELMQQIN